MTIVTTSGSVSGGTTLAGQSDGSEDPPAIDKDSIVNFYSPRNSGMNAISPGGFLSIYRPESPAVNLADFDAERQAPYTVAPLGNAQVFFGATPPPLQFASPGRINVIVPYSVTKYTSTQIRVQRGDAVSLPVEFATSVAQPAVYRRNGTAYAYNATTKAPIGASAPAHAGDILTLYMIGLGEADRTLPDGSISPLSPPARVPGVSVDFGGKPATVEFAGLTPDSVGLYQINIVVPNGISGASVPLTVSIKEQTSSAVKIPLE